HFEKTVYITQGTPEDLLHAVAEINVPERMKSWITIQPGKEFTIPLVKLFPVTIIIDVPEDATPGGYGGEIRITTQPETAGAASSVSIGIGVAIELDLAVVEKEVIDYTVQNLDFIPMEEGWPIKIAFIIDNRGNAKVRPSRVSLEIYDSLGQQLLGSAEDTDLTYVESFKRGNSLAEFPVNLAVGSYIGKVKVYKTEEEVTEFKFPFEVFKRGTLPQPPKSLAFWLSIAGGIVLLAGLILIMRKSGNNILARFGEINASCQKSSKKFKKAFNVLKEK
ncbi:MAG: hypothetical protein AAB577_00990, partial [Patescibacteria group bacterium]